MKESDQKSVLPPEWLVKHYDNNRNFTCSQHSCVVHIAAFVRQINYGIIRGLGFPIWTQPICERGTSRPLGGTAIFCELLPLQCADCAESNINTSQALSGLGLTIDCKLENGEFKTRKVGDINQEGKL
ncbi:unnamed protein product, partial [Vitis vinifera]|uniref:Uncharacterized protein n=1 Tax=Vitis vinifera TaxID=29760 RepID=D7U599_VITVI